MNIATLKDIIEFLYLKGIIWEGEIYSNKSEKYHTATSVDFESKEVKILWCTDKAIHLIGDIGVEIDDFNFIKYKVETSYTSNTYTVKLEKDLSEEWQEFLLKKYKDRYAEKLIVHLKEEKLKVKNNIDNEIALLKKQIISKQTEKTSLINKLTIRLFEAKKLLDTERTNQELTIKPTEQISANSTDCL